MASVFDEREAAGALRFPAASGGRPVSGPLPMSTDGRPPGQIYGEDPILYDRFRPGYPRDLMEAVLDGTGNGPVLEIGAGTGKATRALLALGRPVYALEPDARMAALLELNCGTGAVSQVRATLEDARLPAEAFELAVAAQCWHWIDPEAGYDQAATALIPGGRLALVAHHPRPDQGLLGFAMAQLYAELAPELGSVIWPGSASAGTDPVRDDSPGARRFEGWSRLEHRWSRRLDSVGLVGWLCTSAGHRRLPVEQRTSLMTAVAALVDELGGEVTVRMGTVAHLGYRI